MYMMMCDVCTMLYDVLFMIVYVEEDDVIFVGVLIDDFKVCECECGW